MLALYPITKIFSDIYSIVIDLELNLKLVYITYHIYIFNHIGVYAVIK